MKQIDRTLQEITTSLAPAEVLAAAKQFFTRQLSIYAAFLEQEGPTYVSFRGQGGEELIVAAIPADGATRVTASTYLFDMQVARFFATLTPAPTSPATSAPTAAGAA